MHRQGARKVLEAAPGGATLTSSKSRPRITGLSSRPALAQTLVGSELKKLAVETQHEEVVEEERLRRLEELGDLITQVCRSEGYRRRVEHCDSKRESATSVTLVEAE